MQVQQSHISVGKVYLLVVSGPETIHGILLTFKLPDVTYIWEVMSPSSRYSSVVVAAVVMILTVEYYSSSTFLRDRYPS